MPATKGWEPKNVCVTPNLNFKQILSGVSLWDINFKYPFKTLLSLIVSMYLHQGCSWIPSGLLCIEWRPIARSGGQFISCTEYCINLWYQLGEVVSEPEPSFLWTDSFFGRSKYTHFSYQRFVSRLVTGGKRCSQRFRYGSGKPHGTFHHRCGDLRDLRYSRRFFQRNGNGSDTW